MVIKICEKKNRNKHAKQSWMYVVGIRLAQYRLLVVFKHFNQSDELTNYHSSGRAAKVTLLASFEFDVPSAFSVTMELTLANLSLIDNEELVVEIGALKPIEWQMSCVLLGRFLTDEVINFREMRANLQISWRQDRIVRIKEVGHPASKV